MRIHLRHLVLSKVIIVLTLYSCGTVDSCTNRIQATSAPDSLKVIRLEHGMSPIMLADALENKMNQSLCWKRTEFGLQIV